MQSTMNLLDTALNSQPAPYWTEKLKLSRSALHTAKTRGHLSPAIAGALAEELGEDAQKWIVIAALESERESACKTRMVKKILGHTAMASVFGLAVSATLFVAPSKAIASARGESVYYVNSRMQRLARRLTSRLRTLNYFPQLTIVFGCA